MKLLHVQSLALEAVKVVRLARFPDDRGYFAENYRVSDFQRLEGLEFLGGSRVLQCNESFSRPGTIRGLHFQWNPFQGKLVRTVFGRMVDMVLDIRLTSPTFGKIICYDLPEDRAAAYQEWIWVPPGFAHGTFFPEESLIEYFCTGEYSPGCEAGISPLAPDLDWSLCAPALQQLFESISAASPAMSPKDRAGCSLTQWARDERSAHFVAGRL